MRHILLFFVLLVAFHSASAQFVWQQVVGPAASDETADQMVATATGFVTMGSSVRAGGGYSRLYLSKVSFAGDTLWTRRLVLPHAGGLYPKDMIEDRAGNLVISGLNFPPGGTPGVAQAVLVKLTALGDTVWTRRVTDASGFQYSFGTLVLGNDGNYLAVGEVAGLPVLSKYTTGGALLWNSFLPYNATENGYLQNMVAVPNGYLMLSAPYLGNLPSKFIRVDEQGAYLSERLGSPYYPERLQLDSDGNVLAVGGSLTKLTTDGDTIWSHLYYQFGEPLGLSRAVELPTGQYLVAGTRYNQQGNDIGFALLDHNGGQLRDTLLVRYQSEEAVAGVGLTPGGDYVVAGSGSTGPGTGTGQQLLFAYRNWTRLLPTRPATATGGPVAGLRAYPNPTTEAVTLAAEGRPLRGRWQLLDLAGHAVRGGELGGGAGPRVVLMGLPAGLYLLRVHEDGRAIPVTLRLEKI